MVEGNAYCSLTACIHEHTHRICGEGERNLVYCCQFFQDPRCHCVIFPNNYGTPYISLKIPKIARRCYFAIKLKFN